MPRLIATIVFIAGAALTAAPTMLADGTPIAREVMILPSHSLQAVHDPMYLVASPQARRATAVAMSSPHPHSLRWKILATVIVVGAIWLLVWLFTPAT